jgi:predicted dehydrogenase
MVGFNRRFAPMVVEMKRLLAGCAGPLSLVATVNAGALPERHWTKDAGEGGGRLLGEGIHFVDLLRHLAGAPIRASRIVRASSGGQPVEDVATILLEFANGAIGAIHYFANGDRSFPKERIEAFAGGRVLQLDNFRTLRGFGWPGFRKRSAWRQDKGHAAGAAAFVAALRNGGPAPIPWDEIAEAHRALFSP